MTVTDIGRPSRPRDALAPRGAGGRTGKRIDLQALLRQATNPGADDRHDASVRDILHGRKELHRMREQCETADEYYNGEVGMLYASERVRQLLQRQGVGDDVPDFNYARIPVDGIATRLQVSSVVAAPAEENEDGQEQAESKAVKDATKAIAALRKTNELDAEEKRLHKDVSKHGSAYVLVWPGTDRKGKPSVDIRVNSAYDVIMIYDEEDPLTADYALKSWEVDVGDDENGAPQTCHRANLYYRDRIERWATEPGGNPDKKEAWFRVTEVPDLDDDERDDLAADEFDTLDDEPGVQHAYGDDAMWSARGRRLDEVDDDDDDDDDDEDGYDDEDAPPARGQLHPDDIPNPWGRVPWFHFRNDRPEGVPEHKNAYGPQAMINKIIYAMAGTVDFNSFPQKYIMVDPAQDDPLMNLLDPDHPEDEDDDPENEGGGSGLRNDPGEIWRLYGKSVGQFSAADPNTLLSPLDRLIKSMAELCGMPQWAFSKASADMPSGESVRELNAFWNSTVKDRMDRYDPVWQDVYEFALEVLGITGVTVEVRWAPIEMINDLNGWQVIQAKIASGVPPQVALEEAGYPPEQVKEWLADATGADLGRRVALLNQIGTAVQTLGAGIQLGATSAEQVQEVISRMLGLTVAGTDITIPSGEFLDPIEKQRLNAETQMAIAGMKTGADTTTPDGTKPAKPGATAPGKAPGQQADRGKPPGAPGTSPARPARPVAKPVPTTTRPAPPKQSGA
jgi:hypothetical protein